MGAARKHDEELTPRALKERAVRRMVDALDEYVDARMAELGGKKEWIGWRASPFCSTAKSDERARRRFNALARSGKVQAKRDGKRWLILRDDLDRWIERELPGAGRAAEDADVDAVLERITGGRT